MRLILTATLCVLSFSSSAFGCSCVHDGGCAGLGSKAGPVFLGTILGVTDLPRSDKFAFLSSRKARIQVDESFGGLPPDTREVDVLTGLGGGDCGILFRAGEVYLVAAFVGDDGLTHAGICSETRKIDSADTAVQVLRERRDGKRVPSLTGQIAEYDRNFEGLLGMHSPRPLGGTLVRVKSDGNMYEARSDADGLYALYDLPSGRYEFAPDLPAGTTLSWFIGSDKPLAAFDFKAGSCQERNIEIFPSGSIQGRILDSSNKPLPNAQVFIVPSDRMLPSARNQLYWEFQGKEGFFKFVHIPPGRYVILVNPGDTQDPEFPYRTTFYPGVRDRESAGTITLVGGEQINDADIRLEQQFAPHHLTVRVTWVDGRLVRDFVFVEAKGAENPAAIAHTKQPDLKAGVVDLLILPNEPYQIEAKMICRYADEHSVGPSVTLRSNQIYVGPKDNSGELSLIIPSKGCPEVPGKTLMSEK